MYVCMYVCVCVCVCVCVKNHALLKRLYLFVALTGIAYESAWSQQEGVYFSAVGRSFYEQCFPRDSVHLGFCSHAAIYLSKRFVNNVSTHRLCDLFYLFARLRLVLLIHISFIMLKSIRLTLSPRTNYPF